MRAMRQTLALCTLLMFAGCDDDTSNAPDLAMPDLAPGPDMAVRVPNGVVCGAMTCAVGQECCVTTNGTSATAMCIAAGGTCTGGAVLTCDGPEDCSGMNYCCGTIHFSGGTPDGGPPVFNGGDSTCTGACNFSFDLQSGTVTTRLCHADVDCAGLSLPLGGASKCCSSQLAPGLHFCATAFQGITCP
jgi:hypothetical protein